MVLTACFLLQRLIASVGADSEDSEEIVSTVQSAIVRGPFNVKDNILYLSFEEMIDPNTHKLICQNLMVYNRFLRQDGILCSYLLKREGNKSPLLLNLTLDRAIELLGPGSTVGCLPDPASTTIYINLKFYPSAFSSKLSLCFQTFNQWLNSNLRNGNRTVQMPSPQQERRSLSTHNRSPVLSSVPTGFRIILRREAPRKVQ